MEAKHSVDQVFADQASGKSLARLKFEELRNTVRKGDSIIVQDLSRIGRNTIEVLDFIEEMSQKQVTIHIDDMGFINVTSATGKMILATLAAVTTTLIKTGGASLVTAVGAISAAPLNLGTSAKGAMIAGGAQTIVFKEVIIPEYFNDEYEKD